MIISNNFKARVLDVQKTPNGQNLHKVKVLDGIIKLNDSVKTNIDEARRKKIEVNHSSVHLLQYALRKIISDKILQAGSYVDDRSLRFDFTYTGKLLDDKLIEVEDFINNYVKNNITTNTEIMSVDDAKKTGAMALFSEKYGSQVRVVTIGDSKELCGGTHIKNTSEIKQFAIFSSESKGSNVYRIEACTNDSIEDVLLDTIKPYNDEKIKLLMKARNIISKAKQENIELTFDININNDEPHSYKDIVYEKNELEYTQDEVKNLEKKYKELKSKTALNDLSVYESQIETRNDFKVLITKVENQDTNVIKDIVDTLLNKMGTGLILIANVCGNQASLIIRNNIENKSAGDLMKQITKELNGNGGGSNTFAQGAGKDITKLDEVLNSVKEQL